MNLMTKAFIIGNGVTRRAVDLRTLKQFGTIFGCNALYRDFIPVYDVPDYLVSIDSAMIAEIRASDFPEDRFIVPPMDEQFEPMEVNVLRPRSNAGINAMREAIKMGFDDLVCLGFDFLAVEPNTALSNLYDGTNAYGPETRANIMDTRNRFGYLAWMLEKNPNVNFTFSFPRGTNIYEAVSRNFKLCYNDDLISGLAAS